MHEYISFFVNFLINNWDNIVTIVGAIVIVVRSTAWGRSRQEALDTVVRAIEQIDAKDVKDRVRALQAILSDGSANAIHDAVRKVDPEKIAPSLVESIAEIAMIRKRQN
jgi:hypothetical protein